MIKQYRTIFLHVGTCIGLFGVFLLHASEPKKPIKHVSAQPKTNPNERFNTLAKKIFKAEPTAEASEEFKKDLEKEKKALETKKQCKKELDLLVEDFNARTQTHTLKQKRQEQIERMQKLLVQRKVADDMGIPVKPLSQKVLEPIQLIETQQKEQSIEKPEVKVPSTPPAPTKPSTATLQIPSTPKETIIQKPEQTLTLPPLTATYEEEITIKPPETPEVIEEIIEPEITLQLATLQKLDIKPSTQSLAIISYAEPNFFTAVAQPLFEIAQPESQQKKAVQVIKTTLHVMPTFQIPVQQRITKHMSSIIQQVQESQGQATIAAQTQELTTNLLKQRVTTPQLQDNLRKIGVTDFNTTTDPQKNETLSIEWLPTAIFKVAYKSNLSPQASFAVADTLAEATALVTRSTDEFVPVVGTALVVAPNPETTKNVTHAFAQKLNQLDMLLDAVESRERLLTRELTSYYQASGAAKTMWNALSWFSGDIVKTYRKPAEILMQLIVLCYMLETVGRETVYSIEEAEKNTLHLMDTAIQEEWAQGSLNLVPYVKREGLSPAHARRNNRAELEGTIDNMKRFITKEIEKIPNTEKDAKTGQLVADQLKAVFEQALVPVKKGAYALAEKEAAEQFEQNLLALPAPEQTKKKVPTARPKPAIAAKPTPAKPKLIPIEMPPVQPTPTEAPAIKPVPTPIQPSVPAPVTPAAPVVPTIATTPGVKKEPEVFVPAEPEVKVEEVIETALIPAKTAHPAVTTQSMKQQFEQVKRQIRALQNDITKITDVNDITKVEEQLQKFNGKVDGTAYLESAEALSLMARQVSRVRTIQNFIKKLQSDEVTTSEFINQKEYLERSPSTRDVYPFPKAAYDKLSAEFKKAASGYVSKLIISLEKLNNLHPEVAKDLTKRSELPNNLAEQIATLEAMQEFILGTDKSKLTTLLASLCAFYDATLFALYTPASFAPALVLQKEKEPAETNAKPYETVLNDVIAFFKDSKFEAILETLAALAKQEDFDSREFDLTESPALVKDGAYVYAIKKGTLVEIDPGLKIPIMEAVTPIHKKEKGYIAILEEWQKRIENDTTIKNIEEKLANIANITSTAELKEIAELFEQLEGQLPDEFLQTLQEKLDSPEVAAKAQTFAIKDLIAELEKLITKAQAEFNTSSKKITVVPFKEKYTEITNSIAELAGAEKPALDGPLKLMNGYLTDIALDFNKLVSGLPAHVDKLNTDVGTNISAARAKLDNKNKDNNAFINMLAQINDLGFLTGADKADKTFNSLYNALIVGYGYILTTFDALNAKLIDTIDAALSPSLYSRTVSFFGGSKDDTPTLMGWLGLTYRLISEYFDSLLVPYFGDTQRIKEYNQGKLDLTELGLVNISKPYKYARTKFKASSPDTPITLPNGIHKPTIENIADNPYQAIIKQWQAFLAENKPETAVKLREKQLQNYGKNMAKAIRQLPQKSTEKKIGDLQKELKNGFNELKNLTTRATSETEHARARAAIDEIADALISTYAGVQ